MSPPALRSFLSVSGRHRTLHLTTAAFFLSFVVWFAFAPFAADLGDDLGLTDGHLVTLTLCNLALAAPARTIVGALLDRFGPRRLFSALLVLGAVPNTVFATADRFEVLAASRLLVGVVGAGFVVGIRLVSAWFPEEEIGTAEGIYGGWGNFGSAAAALGLPVLAAGIADGPGAWRWGVGAAGAAAAAYGVFFWFAVDDWPAGAAGAAGRGGRLKVAGRRGALALVLLQVPVPVAAAFAAGRAATGGAFGWPFLAVVGVGAAALAVWQVRNARASAHPGAPGEATALGPVALLSLAYGVTFGAELAVVSLLPSFFSEAFGLSTAAGAAAGSAFAFTNLVTRPGGGVVSDRSASRGRVVVGCLLGTAGSFALLALLDGTWPLAAGVAAVALASVFAQGGNGAVFAMVPLVSRSGAGQVAGLAGSYGNVGGIAFSAVLVLGGGDVRLVFLVIAGAALSAAGLCTRLGAPVQAPASEPLAAAHAGVAR